MIIAIECVFALRSKIQIHTMSVVKVPKKANTAQWTGLMKSKSNRGGVTRGRRSLENSVRVPRNVYREK